MSRVESAVTSAARRSFSSMSRCWCGEMFGWRGIQVRASNGRVLLVSRMLQYGFGIALWLPVWLSDWSNLFVLFFFVFLFCFLLFFWCASPSLASPIVSSLVPHCSCCGSAGAVRVLAGSRRPTPFSCKSPDRPISLPTFVLIRLFSSRDARISPAPASASIAPSSSSISHIFKTIQTTLLLSVWISLFLLAFAHCLCAFAFSHGSRR